MVSAVVAAVALLAVVFLREVPLRTTVSVVDEVKAAVTTGAGAPDLSESAVFGGSDESRRVGSSEH